MKPNDPEAKNLFCRLFSYIPWQEEERKREPIEDFCTEALGYFLIMSETFRQRFISEILSVPLDVKLLDVDTQSFWAAGDEKISGNSRIDMLLESASARIGIESKIEADPQPKQFARYQRDYQNATLFLLCKWNYPREHWLDAKEHGFAIIHWEDVQHLMEQMTLADGDAVASLINQFAGFLAKRGMKYMNMIQNPKLIPNLVDSVKLIDEWSEFLSDRLRIKLFPSGRKNEPYWQAPTISNPSSFFGFSGRSSEFKYAGFEICDDGSAFCYYEDAVTWDACMPQAYENELAEDPTTGCQIEMSHPIDGRIWLTLRTAYPQENVNLTDKLLVIFEGMQVACDSRIKMLQIANGTKKRKNSAL